MRTTPLYRDTLAFAAVLLELMEEVEGFAALRGRLTLGALAVVDAVAQALAGHDRLDRLADAELCALLASRSRITSGSSTMKGSRAWSLRRM